MNVLWARTRAQALELARERTALTTSLLLPALMFLIFGAPNADDRELANYFMTGYAIFAFTSVAYFRFGVGVAQERGRPWEAFLRSLPVSPATRLAARLLAGLGLANVSVAVVSILALLLTPAGLGPSEWFGWIVAVLVGGIPLALLALCLGYWCTPGAAVPVANLLYLGLAWAGGLWGPPRFLPEPVATVSPYLPTGSYIGTVLAAVRGGASHAGDWLRLLEYAVVFAALAVWGYRRDEGRRYR